MSGLKKIRILTVILALTILFNPAVSRAEEEKDDGSSWMADEQDLSVANSLLFVREHLDGVNEATQFYYDFVRSGSLLSKVEDKVVVKIVKILPSGKKDVTTRFLSGRYKKRFAAQYRRSQNPIFMWFFERDVVEMQRYTGGNAIFFRNRIRQTLAGKSQLGGVAETQPVQFEFEGKQYDGMEITLFPYEGSIKIKQYSRYEPKFYKLVLSEEIPGGFYSISSTVESPEKELLIHEVLTYKGIVKSVKREITKEWSFFDISSWPIFN
jgi:hypothetical protein